MIEKLKIGKEIYKNMGWDYVQFRMFYELKRKSGLLKAAFPTKPKIQTFISLEDWKKNTPSFLIESKETLKFKRKPNKSLESTFQKYTKGEIQYFNADFLNIGVEYDWLTNPSNGYQYDNSKHWTKIEDLSTEAGDIKYLWEKSRFSFLFPIIRYDYHFEKDCAEIVFKEIDSWIIANPINQGPNYKCSQEISLRVINWTFALYYYKNSSSLTEERFQKIIHFIYWQIKHDFNNINFSRKTVRNNHAITEVLMLYLGGLLFPFFPESKTWKSIGKKWFEEEIEYQIYEDGTFLQFSHNYHRVLIQLLTLAFNVSESNNERFLEKTYEKAQKTLHYLYQCHEPQDGSLPNYGANDGALFFRFNDQKYRDFRPQLNALSYVLNGNHLFEDKAIQEDVNWFGGFTLNRINNDLKFSTIAAFEKGGIYLAREKNTFTFIHSGSYKDRPSHADNLHLDLWYDGENIMRDAGTHEFESFLTLG